MTIAQRIKRTTERVPGLRVVRERTTEYGERVPLTTPREAAAAMRTYFEAHHGQDIDREHFMVAVLDSRHRIIATETISSGCLTSSLVHPRETFRLAVALAGAAVIVAHNHPSGDAEPSSEDLSLTRRLVSGGVLLGVPVLDHIILAEGERWTSLKERGVV